MIPGVPDKTLYISATKGGTITYIARTQACRAVRYDESKLIKTRTSGGGVCVLTLMKERNHALWKEGIRYGKT
jgi:hypothetical protein